MPVIKTSLSGGTLDQRKLLACMFLEYLHEKGIVTTANTFDSLVLKKDIKFESSVINECRTEDFVVDIESENMINAEPREIIETPPMAFPYREWQPSVREVIKAVAEVLNVDPESISISMDTSFEALGLSESGTKAVVDKLFENKTGEYPLQAAKQITPRAALTSITHALAYDEEAVNAGIENRKAADKKLAKQLATALNNLLD